MHQPAVQHVSEMLTLAQAKHAAAIAAVEARPIDIRRAKAAVDELADAELLAQDCLDWTGDSRLADALVHIRQQRHLLAVGLAKFEQQPSAWSRPWPWISLAIIAAAVLSMAR
jgi:hypothetical protein